jgi:hypothetical protein
MAGTSRVSRFARPKRYAAVGAEKNRIIHGNLDGKLGGTPRPTHRRRRRPRLEHDVAYSRCKQPFDSLTNGSDVDLQDFRDFRDGAMAGWRDWQPDVASHSVESAVCRSMPRTASNRDATGRFVM